MTEHSELGASVTARFWNCPGSVLLSRGLPNNSSIHAQRGTAAHAVGELCLKSGQDAAEYVDRTIEGVLIDEATAVNVQTYLDVCRETLSTADMWGSEQRFDLDTLNPPVPMFGTADFWSTEWVPGGRVLRIVDYKNGWLDVAADNNPQLKYYALGAMLHYGRPVVHIEAIIVQRDTVKRTTFDPIELIEWSLELMRRAAATQVPGAPLACGAWCKFCPAAGQCPEQRRTALAVAHAEFAEPPAPDLLSLVELGEIKRRASLLTSWLSAVDDAITAAISRGEEVPGWKLVPVNSPSKWRDEDEAAAVLAGLHEVDPYQPRKVVSPAKAREAVALATVAAAKLRGLKVTKKSAEEDARATLAPLVVSPSSGFTLAPDTDTRPGARLAGTEFNSIALETHTP